MNCNGFVSYPSFELVVCVGGSWIAPQDLLAERNREMTVSLVPWQTEQAAPLYLIATNSTFLATLLLEEICEEKRHD